MADMVPNSFHYELGRQNLDLTGATTIKLMLLDSNHTQDKDTQAVVGDVSANEVSGTGYTAGGEALTGVSWTQDNTNDRGYLNANDVVWDPSTITGARYGCYYLDGVTKYILVIRDYLTDQSSTNGPFTVRHTNGVLEINQT